MELSTYWARNQSTISIWSRVQHEARYLLGMEPKYTKRMEWSLPRSYVLIRHRLKYNRHEVKFSMELRTY